MTSPAVDQQPPPDLRLLMPAAASWAVGAATLSGGVPARLGGGLLLTAAGVAATLWARRAAPGAGRPGGAHAVYRAGQLRAALALTLVATGLVLGAAALQAGRRDAGTLPGLAEQAAVVRVQASVAGDPARRATAADGRRAAAVLVRLTIQRVDGRGQRSRAGAPVLAFGDERWLALRLGQRIEVTGRLGPARPGDDVVATFAGRGPPTVLADAPAVHRAAERLRAGLRAASSGLPADARGLLPGLVVGDTSAQPDDLGDALRATGLTHLSAVSGTNTTLICLLALSLASGCGLGRRLRLVAAALVLAGFVVLARPEPSVLRAAVMAVIGLLAMGTARRRSAVPALSAAVVMLLVLDPWLARSYGFALSVLATAGLVLLAGPWADWLARRMPRPLAVAIAVPVAAQAMCGPVLVLLSGEVSLVSLPANILAEPCVAPVTVLGLVVTLLAPCWPWGAAALAWPAGLPCLFIAQVARRLATLPDGRFSWPGGGAGALALAGATAVVVLLGPRALQRARAHPGPVAVLAVLVLLAAAPLPGTSSWPPRGWLLVACDVGQGDALVLATGPGRAVLVDAGPDPGAVDRCLRRLHVRALDLIVLTHFHADHVDGLAGALRGRPAGGLVVTIVDDPPVQARRVRRLAAAAGVPVRQVLDGEELVDGPLRAQVLWPARVVRDGSVPNNASIVLRVQVGGLRLLLLGDVEPAAAAQVAVRLAALPAGGAVDVLKVAHHGSAQQDPRLVRGTGAGLALVSVGADNTYGHPAPSLLRALAGQGIVVARTDRQGDLAVLQRAGRAAVVTSGPRAGSVPGRR